MGRNKLLSKEKVSQVIRRWLIDRGVAPTIEELRAALKLGSTRTVLRYLKELETDGEIQRWPGARGIRLLKNVDRNLETTLIPIVGEVTAGPLVQAEEHIDSWVRLPQSILKSRTSKFFLLRVRGDSMNKARVEGDLIEEGDLVLVRQQSIGKPGDIVVALVDGETTIKRLVSGPGYVILKPESTNSKYKPIIVDTDFSVQGIVVRVLKNAGQLLGTDTN